MQIYKPECGFEALFAAAGTRAFRTICIEA